MLICDTCLQKNYTNKPRPSILRGHCELCQGPAICSDIPISELIRKPILITKESVIDAEALMSVQITNQKVPESSNIKEIGYNQEQRVVEVVFGNDARYRYAEVPKEIWNDFQKSESKGSYLARNIKGKFACYKFEK